MDAAEESFSKHGFANSKMQSIADSAGITKVTLYSYFQSKENLYYALTDRAFNRLFERFTDVLDEMVDANGNKRALALLSTYVDYCQSNFLYSELYLNYFEVVRSTSDGQNKEKLSLAMKESTYLDDLKKSSFKPFLAVIKEIKRGQKDKSITNQKDPMLLNFTAWSMVSGFIKTMGNSHASVLFGVDPAEVKNYILSIAERTLAE